MNIFTLSAFASSDRSPGNWAVDCMVIEDEGPTIHMYPGAIVKNEPTQTDDRVFYPPSGLAPAGKLTVFGTAGVGPSNHSIALMDAVRRFNVAHSGSMCLGILPEQSEHPDFQTARGIMDAATMEMSWAQCCLHRSLAGSTVSRHVTVVDGEEHDRSFQVGDFLNLHSRFSARLAQLSSRVNRDTAIPGVSPLSKTNMIATDDVFLRPPSVAATDDRYQRRERAEQAGRNYSQQMHREWDEPELYLSQSPTHDPLFLSAPLDIARMIRGIDRGLGDMNDFCFQHMEDIMSMARMCLKLEDRQLGAGVPTLSVRTWLHKMYCQNAFVFAIHRLCENEGFALPPHIQEMHHCMMVLNILLVVYRDVYTVIGAMEAVMVECRNKLARDDRLTPMVDLFFDSYRSTKECMIVCAVSALRNMPKAPTGGKPVTALAIVCAAGLGKHGAICLKCRRPMTFVPDGSFHRDISVENRLDVGASYRHLASRGHNVFAKMLDLGDSTKGHYPCLSQWVKQNAPNRVMTFILTSFGRFMHPACHPMGKEDFCLGEEVR